MGAIVSQGGSLRPLLLLPLAGGGAVAHAGVCSEPYPPQRLAPCRPPAQGRRPQVPASSHIGPYIVDFLCAEARLVIERDGGQHGGPDDLTRAAHSEAAFYAVLRFWNPGAMTNPDGVPTSLASHLPC